mmetsp:Transcript_4334/g.8712  ORF Transcript_4334/g.8712 Transcript_4334/m.8712 type:complete len:333 (-) Transcript_4334:23-1021(-)
MDNRLKRFLAAARDAMRGFLGWEVKNHRLLELSRDRPPLPPSLEAAAKLGESKYLTEPGATFTGRAALARDLVRGTSAKREEASAGPNKGAPQSRQQEKNAAAKREASASKGASDAPQQEKKAPPAKKLREVRVEEVREVRKSKAKAEASTEVKASLATNAFVPRSVAVQKGDKKSARRGGGAKGGIQEAIKSSSRSFEMNKKEKSQEKKRDEGKEAMEERAQPRRRRVTIEGEEGPHDDDSASQKKKEERRRKKEEKKANNPKFAHIEAPSPSSLPFPSSFLSLSKVAVPAKADEGEARAKSDDDFASMIRASMPGKALPFTDISSLKKQK